MRRREILSLLAGSVWAAPCALAQPRGVPAQGPDRLRRVGVLTHFAENDDEGRARIAAFRSGLRELGWAEGSTVQVLSLGGRRRGPLARLCRRARSPGTPCDPDKQYARPRGSSRRDAQHTCRVYRRFGPDRYRSRGEPGAAWRPYYRIRQLRAVDRGQMARKPEAARSGPERGRLCNPRNASWSPIFEEVKAVAASLGVAPTLAQVGGAADIEQSLDRSADRRSGIIVQPDGMTLAHRRVIIDLARKHRLLAIYPFRVFALDGGLMVYGIDVADQFRRAASYVDRILKGANPGDLPVQAPTKFELVLNLKTAKELGLTIPPSILARASEVIE